MVPCIALYCWYLFSSDYTDDVLGMAVLNQGTFNPVLFTTVDAIIRCTERSAGCPHMHIQALSTLY